jgi:hypothetical protein
VEHLSVEIAPARRLQSERVSKHRAGRQPKMSPQERRRRRRVKRAIIAFALDQKAAREAVSV